MNRHDSTRHAVERRNAFPSSHRHIHDARAFVKIGLILCTNACDEYGEEILRGAVINLDEEGVKSYPITQG